MALVCSEWRDAVKDSEEMPLLAAVQGGYITPGLVEWFGPVWTQWADGYYLAFALAENFQLALASKERLTAGIPGAWDWATKHSEVKKYFLQNLRRLGIQPSDLKQLADSQLARNRKHAAWALVQRALSS